VGASGSFNFYAGVEMEVSDEKFDEIWKSIKLAKDLRKATFEDSDKLAAALTLKLSQSSFALDPKGSAQDLLQMVQEEIEGRMSEVLGVNRSQENFAEKYETLPDFKYFVEVALRATRKLSALINYLDENEPDPEAVEFVEFVLDALDEYNSVVVNGDVVPLIKRGIYASDIAQALEVWANNRETKKDSESFWHGELETRKGVLERLLGGHAFLLQSEFHAGATDTKGGGSIRADFAFLNKSNNISLIEIKTPDSKLLGSKYRGTFPLSKDLSGAISQVLIQRSEIMINYYQKVARSPISFEVFAPRCFLIVGDLSSISGDQSKLQAFEVQRQAVASHVTIVTFDELYEQFSNFNQMESFTS
jgi:hypothetical protein